MVHYYTTRQGDREILIDYYQQFLKLSDEELIEKHNQQKKCGFTGVHRQALYLIALWSAIKKRDLHLELKVIDHHLISFEHEQ